MTPSSPLSPKRQASLALRLIFRELLSQRVRLAFYAACLALGVSAITAVSGFSAQVQETVRRNSRLLLGGDVEIQDVRIIPPALVNAARALPETRGLAIVDEVVAMARTAEATPRLVSVHAVSGDFPSTKGSHVTSPAGVLDSAENLRSSRPGGAEGTQGAEPSPGGAVVDADLARSWNLKVGGDVEISGSRFRVVGLLEDELSRDFTSLALGPRIYVHRDDALKASLVSNTSRFRERVLLSIDPRVPPQKTVEALQQAALLQNIRSPRISHHETNAGTTTRPLRNLAFFLAQVALSTLVLTGLGAASGLGEYLRTRLPDIARYRALGARPWLPTLVLLGVVATVAATGVVVGLLLGETLRISVLVPLVGDLLPLDLATDVVGAVAALDIAAATFGTLVLLCVPLLLRLQKTSPADVLRGEREPAQGGLSGRVAAWVAGGVALAALAALFVRHAPNPKAGLLLFATTVVLFVVFRAFAGALVTFFSKNETRLPPALRLSLAEISSRKETAVLSMALAGLSLFLTCLVQFVKDDLLTPLGNTSAQGKPNLYLVDVQPSQKQGVVEALKARNGGADVYASPMVRARLAAVNGEQTEGRVTLGPRPLGEPDPVEESRRAREREQNLTYRFELGDGERVVKRLKGFEAPPVNAQDKAILWPSGSTPRAEVSVEQRFAERAGLALGDTLSFDVQGVRVDAKITSLRSVSWQNWRPNFFMVMHPSLLEGAPQMNLVATHVATPEARQDVQRVLGENFPNVSVLDAAAIVRRVAELSTGVAEATRFLASLLLGASLLVLAAGVVATRASRMRHYAILRSLGARDKLLSQSLVLEFLWLGGVSGLAGVVAAAAVARFFATEFLEVDTSLSWTPAAVLFLGAIAVNIFVGWVSCASVLRRKPAEVLRQSL